METASFPVVYLLLLLLLLSGVSWFIVVQVLRTRKIESTLSRLQKKLSREKGTAQEHFELGSIYLTKNLAVQAIKQFQQALKAAEGEPEENLAPIYNALGYAYFTQEQYDLAIRNYKESLKVQPNYVTALNNLGHSYERKSLTNQALEAYEQVLTLEANNPTAKRRATSLRKRVVEARS
ncbi:tetratricopeptide repeat protein [Synechococcales cyanobacterium C]|uniref:Tetratricopeptide repeat protein n=1 Tax=Petrachloros mirabilis ULC683 TaxID=2781853 RepID=A0A8K2A885_9CYAN|nr:tetratricopeptide repeat protein [Petrachloros mirabilis]NCJ07731.1 tetratricopeptide repeat protein [Petrachloros mirabilis ULC683]